MTRIGQLFLIVALCSGGCVASPAHFGIPAGYEMRSIATVRMHSGRTLKCPFQIPAQGPYSGASVQIFPKGVLEPRLYSNISFDLLVRNTSSVPIFVDYDRNPTVKFAPHVNILPGEEKIIDTAIAGATFSLDRQEVGDAPWTTYRAVMLTGVFRLKIHSKGNADFVDFQMLPQL